MSFYPFPTQCASDRPKTERVPEGPLQNPKPIEGVFSFEVTARLRGRYFLLKLPLRDTSPQNPEPIEGVFPFEVTAAGFSPNPLKG